MVFIAIALIAIIGVVLVSSFYSLLPSSQVTANPASNNWPIFRHDAARTGFSEGSAPTVLPKQLWNYTVDATATYSADTHIPVVNGGFVYVATADEEQALYGVTCLKSSTRAVIWSFLTDGFPVNSPAVDGNRVYVASGYPWKTTKGYIYCLDASNGAQLWNSSVNEPITSPVNIDAGRVFVESIEGNLYCLDATNGNKIWNYSTGGKADGLCPTVADGYVFAGNNDDSWMYTKVPKLGNIFCLNAANGASIWNFTADDYVSSPAVANGYVYFGSADGNAYCLNASSGEKVWNYTTWFNNAGPAHNYYWGNTVGSPALAYGYVYVGSSDFDIFCLDAFTGEKVWNVTTGAGVRTPAVANNCVYVSSSDGNLYCLNASSGIENWRYRADATSSSIDSGLGSPVVANGGIYIISRQTNSGVPNFNTEGVLILLGAPSSLTAIPLIWIALIVGIPTIITGATVYAIFIRKKALSKQINRMKSAR